MKKSSLIPLTLLVVVLAGLAIASCSKTATDDIETTDVQQEQSATASEGDGFVRVLGPIQAPREWIEVLSPNRVNLIVPPGEQLAVTSVKGNIIILDGRQVELYCLCGLDGDILSAVNCSDELEPGCPFYVTPPPNGRLTQVGCVNDNTVCELNSCALYMCLLN